MIFNTTPLVLPLNLALAICCTIAQAQSAQAAGLELIPPNSENSAAGVELIQPQRQTAEEVRTATATEVEAETNTDEKSMLILDGSGSMWQQIGGKTKIAIAREVVATVVQDWPSTDQLGLMSYGHREKGRCDDIETLLDPAAVNIEAFNRAVGEIAPKGKTPLTAAVEAAAETLKYTENKASVILISDGEETCGVDPCAAGGRLEALGIDFTAHVISFDLPQEKSQGLRCLAESTGGRFLMARDAAELRSALSEAAVVTTGSATPTKTAPAEIHAAAQVSAGSSFAVHWEGPKNRFDRVSVFSIDGKQELTRTYVHRDAVTSPVDLKAPEEPGDYQLRYFTHDKKTLAKADITVIPAQASVVVDANAITAGSKFDVVWSGPKNRFDRLAVFTNDGKTQLEQQFVHRREDKSPTAVTAPEEPGRYLLRYYTTGKNTLAETTIEVIPAEASVQVAESVMAGANLAITWVGPKNERDRLAIFTLDGRQMLESRQIHRRNIGSPTDLEAPQIPGEYLVRYTTWDKNTLAETTVRVTPPTATLEAVAQVQPNQDFEILWSGPNNRIDKIELVSLATGQPVESRLIRSRRAPLILRAPAIPGDFELRYKAFGTRVLISQPLAVRVYQPPAPAN